MIKERQKRLRKKLQEQTICDDFMFSAVMSDAENCRLLLERILEFPIARVEVEREKSIVYHPEYRGVRLDIFARDEENTRYNVEMQARDKPAVSRRARYYHSQMDMNLLLGGLDYWNLPETYVIFICNYDPFGYRKYRYTFEGRCSETGDAIMDGSRTIFLSTLGENEDEVPGELVEFLRFVRADLAESREEFKDPYVKRLQGYIEQIKNSREMEEQFMLLEELMREQKAEGKAEFILELLDDLGEVPPDLEDTIMDEMDMDVLRRYHKLAAHAASIEEFMEQIKQ